MSKARARDKASRLPTVSSWIFRRDLKPGQSEAGKNGNGDNGNTNPEIPAFMDAGLVSRCGSSVAAISPRANRMPQMSEVERCRHDLYSELFVTTKNKKVRIRLHQGAHWTNSL
jgi:hypothetical protein